MFLLKFARVRRVVSVLLTMVPVGLLARSARLSAVALVVWHRP
jgi:hypothetical protein